MIYRPTHLGYVIDVKMFRSGKPKSDIFCVCLYFLLQPSSTLSSYVPACAYSSSNQYGVYSGPGSYVTPGHHWQSQNSSLSLPSSGMTMHGGDIHSSMAFKHPSREGRRYLSLIVFGSDHNCDNVVLA